MDYDDVKKIAEQVVDQHPDKFLYLYERPEFICWFIGRIDDICGKRVSRDIIKAVIMEML